MSDETKVDPLQEALAAEVARWEAIEAFNGHDAHVMLSAFKRVLVGHRVRQDGSGLRRAAQALTDALERFEDAPDPFADRRWFADVLPCRNALRRALAGAPPETEADEGKGAAPQDEGAEEEDK